MAPLKCSVNGCTIDSREVDLYNFPKKLNILQAWIEFCDRGKYWKPRKNSQICSSHFSRADVVVYPSAVGRARQLKPNACPTIKVAPKQKSMTCSVANCKNNANNTIRDVGYYEFPSDDKLRNKWIQFCGRDTQWQPKRINRICSEHFKSEDMESVFMRNKAFRKLKNGAFPSLRGPELKVTNTNDSTEPATKKAHLEINENSESANDSISSSDNVKEKDVKISNESNSNKPGAIKTPSSHKKIAVRDPKNPLETQSRKSKANSISICAVPQCNNTSGAKNSALFYTFPKQNSILSKWIEFCGFSKTWKPNKNSKICSKHFDLKDFDIDALTKKLILKENAIPTLSPTENSTKITNPDSFPLTKSTQVLENHQTIEGDVKAIHDPLKPENAVAENRKESNVKKRSSADFKKRQKSVINIKLPKVSKSSKKRNRLDTSRSPKSDKQELLSTENQDPIQQGENRLLTLNLETPTVSRSSSEKIIEWSSNVSSSFTVKESSKSDKSGNASQEHAPHAPLKITTENLHSVKERTPSIGSLEKEHAVQRTNQSTSLSVKNDPKGESSRSKVISARKKREAKKPSMLSDDIKKTASRKSISVPESTKVENSAANRNPRSKSLDNSKMRRKVGPKVSIDENKIDAKTSPEVKKTKIEQLNISTPDNVINSSSSMEDLFNALSTTLSDDQGSQEQIIREPLPTPKSTCESNAQNNVLPTRGVTNQVVEIRENISNKNPQTTRPNEHTVFDISLSEAKLEGNTSNRKSVNSLDLSVFLQDELEPRIERKKSEDRHKPRLDRSQASLLTSANKTTEIPSTIESRQQVSKVIEVSLHNKKIKKKIKVTLNNNKREESIPSTGENIQNQEKRSRKSSTSKETEQTIDTKNSSLFESVESTKFASSSSQNTAGVHEINTNKPHSQDDSEQVKNNNDTFDKSHEDCFDDEIFIHGSPRIITGDSDYVNQILDADCETNSSFEIEVLDLPEVTASPTVKGKAQSKPIADYSKGLNKVQQQVCAYFTEKSTKANDQMMLKSSDQPKSERRRSSSSKQNRFSGVKSKISENERKHTQPELKRSSTKKIGPKRFKGLESSDDEANIKQPNQTVSLISPNRASVEERSHTNAKENLSRKSKPCAKETPLHDKVIEVRLPFGSNPGRKIRVTLNSKHELSNVVSEKPAKRSESEKASGKQEASTQHCANKKKSECNTPEIENPAKHLNMPSGNMTLNPSEVIVLSPEIKKEAPIEPDEETIRNMNSPSEKSRFDIRRSYPKIIDQSPPTIKTSPFKNDEDYLNSTSRSFEKTSQIFVQSPTADLNILSKSPITLSSSQELQICEVAGCRNNSSKALNGITFHPFPLNVIKRNKWIEFCKDGDDWKPQDFSRICSKHFQPEDYVHVKLQNKVKRVLKLDAIPTVRVGSIDLSSSAGPEMQNLMAANFLSKETPANSESELPKHMERNSVVLLKPCPVKISESITKHSDKDRRSPSEEMEISPVAQGRYSPIVKKKVTSSEDRRQTHDNGKNKPSNEDNDFSAESMASNDSNNEEEKDRNIPSPQSSEKSNDSSDEKYKLRKKISEQSKLISTLHKSNNELKKKSRKQIESFRTMQKRNMQMEQTKKELQRKILNMERTLKRKSLEDAQMSKQSLRNKIMLSPIGRSLTENQIDLLLQIKKKVKWTTAELATAFSLRYLSKDSYIYDYLKEIYPLPDIEIVQKYAQRIVLYGGLLKDVLEIMNTVGKTMTDKERATVLVYDSIPVQSTIQYDLDGDEVVGPYNRMHIVMARGLYSDWKQPVYLDFDRNLTAEELKNMVSELNDVQFNVVAFVCDCSQPKLNLLLELGVSGKNTFFEHPSTQAKICCFFDPPRLLEMMRKALVTKGFTFVDGTEMTREPLNKLLESGPYIFPDGTLFSPENMLNPSDEEAGNYDHAMELFSLTIATLLRKSSDRESLVLAKFIETMYRWFQIMSSLYVDGNEQLVLHYKDREEQIAILNKTYEMVKSLRCIETNRINIFQEAILISIRSMECLSKEMSSLYSDKSVLGNKLSQNSLDALLFLLQSSNKAGNVPPMNAIEKLRAIIFGVSNEVETQSILILTEEYYMTSKAFEDANLKPIIREKSFEESLFTNSIKLDANTVIKNIEEENILDPLVEYLTKKHRKQFCSSDGKLPPKLSLIKNARAIKFNALSFSNYARQMKSLCLNLEEIFKQINKDGTLLYKTKALKNFTDRVREDVDLHPEIIKSFLLQRILVRLKYLNLSMDNDSSNDTDTDTF